MDSWKDSRPLLMDHDTKFSAAFCHTPGLGGDHALRFPPKTPSLNTHVERFFPSIKEEGLDKVVFFGDESLENAVKERLTHSHTECDHQGLDNRLIDETREPPAGGGSAVVNALAGRSNTTADWPLDSVIQPSDE